MSEREIFSRQTVLVLVTVGIVAFVGSIYLGNIGGDAEYTRPAGPNAFSEAATGYAALPEILNRLGIPVLVSRNDSVRRAGRSGVLVVAEPPKNAEKQVTALLAAPVVFYVLPKWHARPAKTQPRWVEGATLLPLEDVQKALHWVLPDGDVVRLATIMPGWRRSVGLPEPSIWSSPQLIANGTLAPVVATRQGVLVGSVRRNGHRIIVLSDPDLLSNHGIGRGDNAALVAMLLDASRHGGAVVVDETIHGFRLHPSLFRTFMKMPYAMVTIATLAAVIILVWATAGRFGTPWPAARPLEAGKETLIDSTADLLLFGGHLQETLRRYRAAVQRRVARRLHAPRGLDRQRLIAWLDAAGSARATRYRYESLYREVDLAASAHGNRRTLALARRLRDWEREMTNGPGDNPVDRQQPEG